MRQEPDDEDPTGRRFSATVARLRGRRARRECYVEIAAEMQNMDTMASSEYIRGHLPTRGEATLGFPGACASG